MMLFRKAHQRDLIAIHELAERSGVGMTTLPKDLSILKKRLHWSAQSFRKTVQAPENEYYLFVLEDPDKGNVVGLSAIQSAVGYDAPFYSYKLSKHTRICHSLNIRSDFDVLSLVNDNQGHSEICTLFLDPAYRKNKNGILLSCARFLFIAQYPSRFAPTIIAEMRGVSDDAGRSPFWDQVGAHFFHLSFREADELTLATNKQFIADLMPRNPLYIKMLTPEAQAVIGKPHPSTLPAMNILLNEGFRFNQYVDIFDAGPTIEAQRHQIRTIANSQALTIERIETSLQSDPFILSNTHLHFRATLGPLIWNTQQKTCIINHETADLLKLKRGDTLRSSPLHKENS